MSLKWKAQCPCGAATDYLANKPLAEEWARRHAALCDSVGRPTEITLRPIAT